MRADARPDRRPGALAGPTPAADAHRRAQAERQRQERWRDLQALLGVLAAALLVVHGLPPG